MSERHFFDGYIGKMVEFDELSSSRWTLTEKLGDKNDQKKAYQYEESQAPSCAYGTFLCENSDTPNQTAVMKIFLQIPHAGCEYSSDRERAKLSTQNLPFFAETQIDSLQRLTQNQCSSTPKILAFKRERQNAEGIVPDGFEIYLLMNRVPGKPLGDGITRGKQGHFWDYRFSERERIREAFRVAWTECVNAGVLPVNKSPEHLFWDFTHSKIFRSSQQPEQDGIKDTWSDRRWIAWGLAMSPPGYRWYMDDDPHPDTSAWEM